ncbi:hypothetical protein [Streptomyces chumphonensis]|uniref:hypothetical protein n=1 Tax=Streptomyces chumphonensis TaxID=1214925 RepID=UPI003D7174E9
MDLTLARGQATVKPGPGLRGVSGRGLPRGAGPGGRGRHGAPVATSLQQPQNRFEQALDLP